MMSGTSKNFENDLEMYSYNIIQLYSNITLTNLENNLRLIIYVRALVVGHLSP